mmetsp:Transcript_51985/g.114015  ORF Transcript_51985/g.114015 Transcript_51985/m.114015 type:complete len:234 (+) Transcript_51985:1541-2242(+)
MHIVVVQRGFSSLPVRTQIPADWVKLRLRLTRHLLIILGNRPKPHSLFLLQLLGMPPDYGCCDCRGGRTDDGLAKVTGGAGQGHVHHTHPHFVLVVDLGKNFVCPFRALVDFATHQLNVGGRKRPQGRVCRPMLLRSVRMIVPPRPPPASVIEATSMRRSVRQQEEATNLTAPAQACSLRQSPNHILAGISPSCALHGVKKRDEVSDAVRKIENGELIALVTKIPEPHHCNFH